MGTAVDDPDHRLPDYYSALGVNYRAKQDVIRDAFLALSQTPLFDKNKKLICDAFMCLASADDRASYDVFYFHTPCCHSYAHWLAYRNERRRLAWDKTAEINTRHLVDLQHAVAEATHAALADAAATAAAAAPRTGPPAMHRHRQRHRTKAQAEAKEEREQQAAVAGPRPRSDSDQSDNTMVEAPPDGLAEDQDQQALDLSVATAVAAVHNALPSRVLPRKPVPKTNGVTDAPSTTGTGRPLPLVFEPKRPGTTGTRPGMTRTAPLASASASAFASITRNAPAHPAQPASTATKSTGKGKSVIATGARTTSTSTRTPAASTATAMTASAALKASGKTPATTTTTTRPTGASAAKRAATMPTPARARAPLPARAPPPKTAASLKQKTPTATARATAAAAPAAPATSATAVQASSAVRGKDSNDSNDSNVPPFKRPSLANSRWADSQTCANGQPGHPQDLGNWQRLARPGKCTACGCAGPGQAATSHSHLHWCGKCDASFCNKCYISKIIRRQ